MESHIRDIFSRPVSEPLSTGILPSQTLRQFVESGYIVSPFKVDDKQVQPASIDLRLGRKAYRVKASFLPGKSTVEAKLQDLLVREIDLQHPTVFPKGEVFIVELVEGLFLPKDVSGRANPKSTTGRLDIFTRLITEGAREFEYVPKGYKGKLYLEVVSRTFPIILRAGITLNQLRLVKGDPPHLTDGMLEKMAGKEHLVYENGEKPTDPEIDRGLRVSVDLQGNGTNIVGYKARSSALEINLDRVDYYDVRDFWEPILTPHSKTIILEPRDFYILASRERISVPPTHAAEMVPFDASIGEFRVHYAGFFDPGFGHGVNGTKAVLEVRAHEVPILLEDGQLVGALIYHKMAQVPDKIYGPSIGSSYQQQGLALSKQFKRPQAEHQHASSPATPTVTPQIVLL